MTKIRDILLLFVLFLLTASCSNDIELIDDQREDIVGFLTKKHDPKLIAESKISESIEDEPAFYTTSGKTVFRYIADYYNPERVNQPELKRGDTIYITFWCYDFSSFSTPTAAQLYYTNDPSYKDAFVDAGLNIGPWPFEPKKVVLGSADILKTIEDALVGCRVGDSVEIFLTYNMAYGSNWVGVSTLEAPMAFYCTIESIEN